MLGNAICPDFALAIITPFFMEFLIRRWLSRNAQAPGSCRQARRLVSA